MSSEPPGLLPVHGFVLAGGRSSRMGRDKALLPFCGRPMVEIAVEKLRSFCAAVSIVGNREDLAPYAPVLREERQDCGPVAGVEAGLLACEHAWAMFIPVDAPLMPAHVLRTWAATVLRQSVATALIADSLSEARPQPAFCMIRRDRLPLLTKAVADGERRLSLLLTKLSGSDGYAGQTNLADIVPGREASPRVQERWFRNLNTPEELQAAESENELLKNRERHDAAV